MYEKPKRKHVPSECPICGGIHFEWGKTHIFRGNSFQPIAFRSENAGFFESSKPLSARRCTNCGNVQLFVDVN